MSDLESLRKILARQSIPWSDWPVDPEVDLDGGRAGAVHTLSLGCPDSVGAYTEFLFDRRGRLLAAGTLAQLRERSGLADLEDIFVRTVEAGA